MTQCSRRLVYIIPNITQDIFGIMALQLTIEINILLGIFKDG